MSTTKLPLLPGYDIVTEPRVQFFRNQTFGVNNGIRLEKAPIGPGGPPPHHSNLIAGGAGWQLQVRRGEHDDHDGEDLAPAVPARVPATTLPSWIAYSNKVLRFYAYFKEAVNESSIENWRVRKCTIYFFLEDNSVKVSEDHETNAGIAQGLFLRRHRVPFDANTTITADHLRVGREVVFYGRCLKIYDADGWTRDYLDDRAPAEGVPVDPFHVGLVPAARHPDAGGGSVSRFQESANGKPSKKALAKVKQMLSNQNKVLRFWAHNENPTPTDSADYVVHYFLADDTMEILREKDASLGYDAPPMLIRRQPLPRHFVMSNAATIGSDDADAIDCFRAADLRLGATITVFGRRMKLVRADPFTVAYYKDAFGLTDDDLRPIAAPIAAAVVEARPKHVAVPAQSSLNIGSDNRKRHGAGPAATLRFLAQMQSKFQADCDRRFIITFDVGIEQLSVFEHATPNSGFAGGKMMEKSHERVNPSTGAPFAAGDFHVGAALIINGFRFVLLESDESTMKYMESHSAVFPHANVDAILERIKQHLTSKNSNTVTSFRQLDVNRSSVIDVNEFKGKVEEMGWHLNAHEVLTLFRAFDRNRDGLIDLQEFVYALQ